MLGARTKRPISSPTPDDAQAHRHRLLDGAHALRHPRLHRAHRSPRACCRTDRQYPAEGQIAAHARAADGAGLAGSSLFWGGLARLDVIDAPPSARLTFVSACTNLRVSEVRCRAVGGFDAAGAHYAAEAGRTLTPPLTAESARQLGGLEMRSRVELERRRWSRRDISISARLIPWRTARRARHPSVCAA